MDILLTRVLPSWLFCLAAFLLVPGATEDAASDDQFSVLEMLAGAAPENRTVFTSECVSKEAQAAFLEGFGAASETMLKKTKRSMHDGLVLVAKEVVKLVQACSCGSIPTLERMKVQAGRLEVFATARGMLSLGSQVSYTPMKELMVGGVDVHQELNELLVAWKLNKGEEEVGRALMKFMEEFADEEAREGEEEGGKVESAEHVQVAPSNDPHRRGSVAFWTLAMNSAFATLGDSSSPVRETCLTESDASALAQSIEDSFELMLGHSRRKMHGALEKLGNAVQSFIGRLLSLCSWLDTSMGLKHFRSAASRLLVFAPARTLMNFGSHIEYEALKVLKVGGIDVHQEINEFIGSWRKNDAPSIVGVKLAKFFEDFSEEEAPKQDDSKQEDVKAELSLMSTVLRDAFAAASGESEDAGCFSEAAELAYEADVEAAIAHILKKRKRTMQQGLKEFGDATDRLIQSLPRTCSSRVSSQIIGRAARKLKRLTRRTVVDYGTHIKYEAMQSLSVGGVDIHREINAFIGAWSLGNRKESGSPLGALLFKLSQIQGHDEF